MFRIWSSRAFPARSSRQRFVVLVHPKASLSTGGAYSIPKPYNEPNKQYAANSPERAALDGALSDLKSKLPLQTPRWSHGQVNSWEGKTASVPVPSKHTQSFSDYPCLTATDVTHAIEDALAAKEAWQDMPFTYRAAIFLRAAELITTKYRYEITAATMLGQGKNAWQAEIDAAAELADFFRFNVAIAQKIYEKQPTLGTPGHHTRNDYRPLEGFVYAISPFNFTAIGGNLVSVPAIMGNVVLWKPSPSNVYASSIVYRILLEAGLPPNVVQFLTGDAELITNTIFEHCDFAALHFTGSSNVFRSLFAKAAQGVVTHTFREYPRMVGETSGKNFHLVHSSADISSAVRHTIRAAFEYAGQKCSACSRLYLPQSRAQAFLNVMKEEMQLVTVGQPEDYSAFLGPVINQQSFQKISQAIDEANKDPDIECVIGGTYDGSEGYFIQPTMYVARKPDHWLFNRELFGPVLGVYIYPDDHFEELLTDIDQQGGGLALTGAIFARDQRIVELAERKLRYAAGNLYVNCKTTAALIGQQTFGGSRSSGTNDKAGSENLLMRFVSPRTLKEEFGPLDTVLYPSNSRR